RFDTRRQLIVEEANNIGTAYLRLDLLPTALQPPLRDSFRRYLDARIDVYRKLPDIAAAKESLAKANELQGQIWRQAVAASRAEGAPAAAPILLLPALNAMIDITTTRTMATQMHPPAVVFVMLFGLALAASLLAGYGMTGSKVRSWFHMLGFALVMATAVYVILDIESPRLGLIRVDAFDQALVDLRESMNPYARLHFWYDRLFGLAGRALRLATPPDGEKSENLALQIFASPTPISPTCNNPRISSFVSY